MLDAAPPPQPAATEIVVTAPALPEPRSERAFSVETITRADLVNSPTTQLEEVLREVAGLQLFRRSDSRSGHPTSQGVTMRALGGTASSRALLVLDGVPQSDPFGGWINWPAYVPAALAEVGVIRGGGSVAQGPGALAGTIDMVSSLGAPLHLEADAGSRGSLEGTVSLGAALGGGRLAFSGRAARGDGFTPVTASTRGPADRPAPYSNASGRLQWVAPVGGSIELQASAAAFRDRRERGLEFTGNRTDGADLSLRLVGGRRWSALAYGQWRTLDSSFASVDAARSTATRVSFQDEVPSRAFGGSIDVRPVVGEALELRLGADARFTRGESRELYSYSAGEPTRRRKAGGATATAGLFGEAAIESGGLTLTGGARLDHWRVEDGRLFERLIATGAALRDDRYGARSGWLPTARAGLAVDAAPGLTIRSAAYLGWRPPTLNELFRPFRAGPDATAANAELDPERLAGIEAGGRFERGGFGVSLTLFANRLSDAIGNVTLGEGPGTFPGVGFVGPGGQYRQRRNLDAIVSRGLEVSAELRRGAWSLGGGASLVDAEVEASGPAAQLDRLRPAQTPRFTFSGSLSWQEGARAAGLTLRHTGAQFEDDLNLDRLPSATTLDAFLAWPLVEHTQLVLRGENLLDTRVVAAVGDGIVERATPRTLWIGLRFGGS